MVCSSCLLLCNKLAVHYSQLPLAVSPQNTIFPLVSKGTVKAVKIMFVSFWI